MALDPAARRVWCLLAGRAGDDAQVVALARAIGWPFELKRLRFNRLRHGPNLLLGSTLASLDRARSDPLLPPWPDLVIAAARHSAPVALWIGKRAGGRTRLVHLQYAEAPLERFDLVLTMPHFCLPKRPNVLELAAPLNRPDPERMADAEARWRGRIDAVPAPRTALLVGGCNSAFGLDEESAARLGREANRHVRERGGGLLVTTSPRTPAAAADALEAALDVPALFYRWRPDDPENPYPAYLARADGFIVTADSSSLIAEACSTARPVYLFSSPPAPGAKPRLRSFSEWLGRKAEGSPAMGDAYGRMTASGLLKTPRDFAAYHEALRRRGLLHALGDPVPSRPPEPLDDLERAACAVHAMFE